MVRPSPPLSLEGDIELILGDGSRLLAHSLYLSQASQVLKDALALASSSSWRQEQDGSGDETEIWEPSPVAKRPRMPASPPMPGVTTRQAQLLLHVLYAWKRETFMDVLGPPELIELATIADKFGYLAVLQLADEALANKAASKAVEPWLMVLDAPAQHQLARRLHLTGYEALVGRYLGTDAHKIDLARLDPSSAAILEGARAAKP